MPSLSPLFAPPGWVAALQQLPPQRYAVLVSVIQGAGSVPRSNGARMLVTQRHQYDTIGGGHLEWQAAQKARAWLDEPLLKTVDLPIAAQPRFERMVLGASLGQCCGGVVELRYDRLDAYSNLDYAAFLRELQQQQPALPQLYLFGAGHVARALVQVLEQTPCQITWVDEREDLFPAGLPAHITIEATDTPEAVIAAAPAGSHFLVMTHHHGLDLRLTEQILKRHDLKPNDNGWFGLIGSRTKRASFSHRLLEKGITPTRLQTMVCPIGLPAIQGKEPGVIALAVAAQLWQVWSQQRHNAEPEKVSDVASHLMTT
jgi:xanthine dehydrogenase accessory factor